MNHQRYMTILSDFSLGKYSEVVKLCQGISLDLSKSSDQNILNALVLSYAKLGNVEQTLVIFEQLANKSLSLEITNCFLAIFEDQSLPKRIEKKSFLNVCRLILTQFPHDEAIRTRTVRLMTVFECIDAGETLKLMSVVKRPQTNIWFEFMIQVNSKLGFYDDVIILIKQAKKSVVFNEPLAISSLRGALQTQDITVVEDLIKFLTKRKIESYLVDEAIANAYVSIGSTDKAMERFIYLLKRSTTLSQKASILYNASLLPVHNDYISKELDLIDCDSRHFDPKDQELVHFAKAWTFRKLKKFDSSVAHTIKGNNLINSRLVFNLETYIREISDAFEAHDKLLETSIEIKPIAAPTLFFVGLPRSGSTFLADRVFRLYDSENLEESDFLVNFFQQIVTKIKAEEKIQSLVDLFPAIWAKATRQCEKLVIDKSLSNFKYLPLLQLFFSNSCITWTSRPSDDHLWGIYKQRFVSNPLSYTANPKTLKQVFNISIETQKKCRCLGFDFIEARLEHLATTEIKIQKKLNQLEGVKLRQKELTIDSDRVSNTAANTQIRSEYFHPENTELDYARKHIPALFNLEM